MSNPTRVPEIDVRQIPADHRHPADFGVHVTSDHAGRKFEIRLLLRKLMERVNARRVDIPLERLTSPLGSLSL